MWGGGRGDCASKQPLPPFGLVLISHSFYGMLSVCQVSSVIHPSIHYHGKKDLWSKMYRWLWKPPPKNQLEPLIRWPSANTASHRGDAPPLLSHTPSSLVCNLSIKELYLRLNNIILQGDFFSFCTIHLIIRSATGIVWCWRPVVERAEGAREHGTCGMLPQLRRDPVLRKGAAHLPIHHLDSTLLPVENCLQNSECGIQSTIQGKLLISVSTKNINTKNKIVDSLKKYSPNRKMGPDGKLRWSCFFLSRIRHWKGIYYSQPHRLHSRVKENRHLRLRLN